MKRPSAAKVTTPAERCEVRVLDTPDDRAALARDVRAGLGARPYRLPPRYFYDDVGSTLFDRICDTPEYYLTRAETALLERVAADIVRESRANELVELGSGAARKTRLLLDALVRSSPSPRYVPIDVNEAMLRESARGLLSDYATLSVHGIVGDYRQHLREAPGGGHRIVAFLGSSIGNYAPGEAEDFLARVGAQMTRGDTLLVGFDLVKDVGVLERAYNDAQGLTAAFNRNVLTVLNRELSADFDPAAFEHVAFYDASSARIEMHLRAREAHVAHVARLDLRVPFARGEGIHTEISRKFTRETALATLERAGFATTRWDVAEDNAFGLALATLP